MHVSNYVLLTKPNVEWIELDMNWNAQEHSKWQLLINDGWGPKDDYYGWRTMHQWLEDTNRRTVAQGLHMHVRQTLTITMDNDEQWIVGNNSDDHKRVAWLAEDIIKRKCHGRQKIMMKESGVVSTCWGGFCSNPCKLIVLFGEPSPQGFGFQATWEVRIFTLWAWHLSPTSARNAPHSWFISP